MKIGTIILIISCCAFTPLCAFAGTVSPAASAKESKGSDVEDILSLDYGKLLADDSWHILSAPSRWNTEEWLWAGLGASAVVATAALADKPLEKQMAKNRSNSNDKFSKAIQPFGAEYSFAVLGAFEAGGLMFKDDNARATAQDGLASSLVASGFITLPLKYIVGRNRPGKDKGAHSFSPFTGGADSFPSGHATQAFAVASVVADHYDPMWVKVAAYGTASAVGYARVERRAHWASDVLAGALIGTLVGKEIVRFNRNKRYEVSVLSDGDTKGIQIAHRF